MKQYLREIILGSFILLAVIIYVLGTRYQHQGMIVFDRITGRIVSHY